MAMGLTLVFQMAFTVFTYQTTNHLQCQLMAAMMRSQPEVKWAACVDELET
jgi:hypothetical protein